MTTETTVETPVQPEVETQNLTPEAPKEEVAQPEGEGQEPQKPELSDAEKKAKALERRVARLTRERYQREAEMEVERKQWQQRADEQPAEPKQLTPEDIDRRAQELAEAREFNRQCNALVAEGKKEFKAEFEDSLAAIRDEGLVLLTPKGEPTAFLRNILDSDIGAHKLLHYLGQNPDIAAEIADMSPGKQARRLGKIEDELSAPPKRSSAPAPLKPLKGGSGSGEPDPNDTKAWVAWRNKQLQDTR